MESAIVTPPWTLGSRAVGSKVAFPHSGLRCLQVEGNAFPYYAEVHQDILTPLFHFHVTGWMAGDGVSGVGTVAYGAGNVFVGTTSAAWQEVNVIAAAVTSRFSLYYSGVSGSYSRHDDIDVREHPQVTRSLSKQPGALNYARLGDGHTASTIPGQRSGGRGLIFSAPYRRIDLDWTSGGPLDVPNFTFLACGNVLPSAIAGTSQPRLYEVGGIAGGLKWYTFYWDVSTLELVFRVYNVVSVLELRSKIAYPDGSDHVYAASIDSLGVKMYMDGTLLASVAGDRRLPFLPTDSNAYIGNYTGGAGAGTCFTGTMYQAAIYPFALSETQVREWGRRARQARNI